jgi:hypothetical protein
MLFNAVEIKKNADFWGVSPCGARLHIPEGDILHSHRREHPKSYTLWKLLTAFAHVYFTTYLEMLL